MHTTAEVRDPTGVDGDNDAHVDHRDEELVRQLVDEEAAAMRVRATEDEVDVSELGGTELELRALALMRRSPTFRRLVDAALSMNYNT